MPDYGDNELAKLYKGYQSDSSARPLSTGFQFPQFSEDDLNTKQQLDSEKQLSRRQKIIKASLKGAELAAFVAGQPELAKDLGLAGTAAGEGGHAASKISGGAVARAARRSGVSGRKSSALGGAVAGALQGKNTVDIAKNAWNWYALYIAFGALFTFIGSLPALIYLDFHYLASKFGSKIFGEMRFWQKIILAMANGIFLFVLLLVVVLVMGGYCLVKVPFDLFGSCFSFSVFF